MLEDLSNEFGGEAVTPAANYLHDVNKDCTKLSTQSADLFHHNVAKLLFLCKRARPNIQTAVLFLTTRVKRPDKDNWKKLIQVMKYLRATINLLLRLEADGSGVIKWWVDAAFAVHGDMRGHSEG
eukprot:3479120-Ditylum_brightwellii.AAC.1